ncbi:MAG: hypothetical protein LBG82_06865 [Clostridiales Family XIII bacterium]|jgi:hypothetical protein|nr:hypothetical protein [Clostridiales Family XIII bacterium]
MIDRHEMFIRASEYTGFHKKLALLAAPYLDREWSVADIGCGLALIDFHLAHSVKSITAMDSDAEILARVESRIDEELAAGHAEAGRISTLRKRTSDAGSGGERWDAVVLGFSDVDGEAMGRLLTLADHRGIIIMHGQRDEGIFDPVPSVDRAEHSASQVEGYLRGAGYGFRKSVVDLQFGQPFRTIDDIHEFLRSYEAERLIYSVEERIIKTKRYDYPYYLPRNMRVAVFIVATDVMASRI